MRATGEGKRFLFGVRRANKIDDDDEAVHQEESSNLDGPAGFALKQKKRTHHSCFPRFDAMMNEIFFPSSMFPGLVFFFLVFC